ncbi:hypothetical protein AAC691_15490 [Nguyenibacter vanlangensis]|uniref:Uncharacterized protein n=1 Tax=Nguyenibacter vanlangensis TaxID=1216886 RepID=A0ABZ3D261_9PROT
MIQQYSALIIMFWSGHRLLKGHDGLFGGAIYFVMMLATISIWFADTSLPQFVPVREATLCGAFATLATYKGVLRKWRG